MNWGPLSLSLWPGLARLWMRGEWSALILAVGFSLMLNLALVSTFVWPELIGPGFSAVVWPVLGLVWLVSAWSCWQQQNELFTRQVRIDDIAASKDETVNDRLFIEAQTEYLKGNWERTQLLLERQLGRFPRDASSRLLLATMYRRTGKLGQSQLQLDELEKIDQSKPWQFEIARERELTKAARSEEDDAGQTDLVQDLPKGLDAGEMEPEPNRRNAA